MTNDKEANLLRSTLASRGRHGLTLAALVVLSACGASVETSEGSPEIGTMAAAFKDSGGADAFEFITQMPTVSASGQTGGFDPALCSNNGHAGFLFVRDRSDFVQTYNYSGSNPNGWTRYGNSSGTASPKTFAGRLSCTANGLSTSKFVVAGRGKTDNLLYWSAGTVTNALSNPYSDASFSFSTVHPSNTYTNSPALASHNGQVFLTVVKNGQLYAYYKNPNANWTGPLTAPGISGWSVQGTPAVAYVEAVMQQYHIYVRATRTVGGVTSTRFQRTYFTTDHFSGPASLSSPVMEPVSLVGNFPAIDSDPALEWTGAAYEPGGLENVVTLYYRSGSKFYDTSGDLYPEEHPPEPVTSNNNPTFVGTPSIHGGIPYEIGQHWFVGQDMSNKIWFGSSENDSALIE